MWKGTSFVDDPVARDIRFLFWKSPVEYSTRNRDDDCARDFSAMRAAPRQSARRKRKKRKLTDYFQSSSASLASAEQSPAGSNKTLGNDELQPVWRGSRPRESQDSSWKQKFQHLVQNHPFDDAFLLMQNGCSAPPTLRSSTSAQQNMRILLCSKCHSSSIRTTLIQTRSCDEGSTAFHVCIQCDHKWRGS